MAERIPDNAELLVDEMKRKARRRLVGAIVLALAAAIILPLLLEKDPRPLGDDVSVQIPPVDQGKFVNRLTGKTGEAKALPKGDSKPITAPAKSQAKADAPAESAPAPAAVARENTAAITPDGKGEPKSEAKPAPKAEAKAATPSEPGNEAKTAVAPATPAAVASAKSAPAASEATPAGPPAAAAIPKPDGFVVQLAAFADDKGANALANKLKKSGYAAYVEPINTSRGTLWRVRVGGYVTRPEADAARVALKGEGYSGIITSSQ